MSLDEATLIDLIEKFPQLWDKKNSHYDDKIAVENAWRTVSSIVEIEADECKTLWKSIRTKYIRERRIIKNLPSGSASYNCKWPLYDRCGFLDKVIVTRRTKGNILNKKHSHGIAKLSEVWNEELSNIIQEYDGKENEEASEDEERRVTAKEMHEINICSSPDVEDSSCTSKHSQPTTTSTRSQNLHGRYLKRKKGDIPLEKLVDTCNTIGKNLNNLLHDSDLTEKSDVSSEDHYFVMSLARSLSSIKNDSAKMLLKAKILTLISEELGNSS